MATTTSRPKAFTSKVAGSEQGRVYVPVPFDPAKQWGKRDRYHLGGTLNGLPIRAVLEPGAGGHLFSLGAAWRRDNGLKPGDAVRAVLAIEGPQRDALTPDFARALKAEPAAARFWDSVAQFYRKGYLRWIDATRKRPAERSKRIAEVVRLLKAGRKQW